MDPGHISESDLMAMFELAEQEVQSFGHWPYGTGRQRAYAHVIHYMAKHWMPKPKTIIHTPSDAETRIEI